MKRAFVSVHCADKWDNNIGRKDHVKSLEKDL
jgi:hypothetical protein